MKTPTQYTYKEAFCLMRYESPDGRQVEWIWNSQDHVTPFCVTSKDGVTELRHAQWEMEECRPHHQLQPGDRYFGPITKEAAERYAEIRMKSMDGTEYEVQGEARAEIQARVLASMLTDDTPDLIVYEERAPETVCNRCNGPGAPETFENQACLPINGKVQCIDWCIHHIVAALNAGGIGTIASCCGHGAQRGRIDLNDGRTLWIGSQPPQTD